MEIATVVCSKALVTGSAKRIGRSMVLYLASIGYDVALHYNRSESELVELRNHLVDLYPNRQFPLVQFNLEDWKNVASIFDQLPVGFNSLDLLVNNASIFSPSSLKTCTPNELENNFAVHLFAPFLLMQEYNKRYKSGLIVNLLDTKIVTNCSLHAPYLLSKQSFEHLTKMAALEWAPNIRVNAIAPGPVLPATGANSATFNTAVAVTPLNEAVELDEITNSLGYFINCKHVTGQVLFVDSGLHLI